MNSICRVRSRGTIRQPTDGLINVILILNNKSNKSLHRFIQAASQFSCLSNSKCLNGLINRRSFDHKTNDDNERVNNLGNFQFVKSNSKKNVSYSTCEKFLKSFFFVLFTRHTHEHYR